MPRNPCRALTALVLVWLAPAAFGAVNQPSLDGTRFSGGDRTVETILHVPALGRYALKAQSKVATRLELVDRMAGTIGNAGGSGSLTRLDMFLEPGEYKLRITKQPSDSVDLSVDRFLERAAPVLPSNGSVGGELRDLELAPYWIRVEPGSPSIVLEVQGRSLADAALWKDGLWETGIRPLRRSIEMQAGKPITVLEFNSSMEPGDYLLVCAGGPRAPWAKEDTAEPFFLSRGARYLGDLGIMNVTLPDRGTVSFLVSGRTQYVQMEAQNNKGYTLLMGPNSPGYSRYGDAQKAVISEKSSSLRCSVYGRGGGQTMWVTIQGPPGETVELRWLAWVSTGSQSGLSFYELDNAPGRHLTTVLTGGEGPDSIDTTGMFLQITQARNKPTIDIKASEPLFVSPDAPLRRRVNLISPFSFLLQPKDAGTYAVLENDQRGASGLYRFRLLDDALLNGPQGVEVKPGARVELQEKLYVVSVRPVKAGILDFAVVPAARALTGELFTPPAPAPRESLFWASTYVERPSGSRNILVLGSRDRVPAGVQTRSLPLDIEQPACSRVDPSQTLILPFTNRNAVTLNSTNVAFSPGTALIDGVPWTADRVVPPGSHTLAITNRSSLPEWHVIAGTVPDTSATGPRPAVVDPAIRFPTFSEGSPAWRNFARNETAAFLLEVREPASYRVTTAGRLAMGITIRTYLKPSLVSVSQNADGRNAAVTSYLRPGTYLVQAQTQGASMGRAGVALERLDVVKAGSVAGAGILRSTVPAGTLMAAELRVDREAAYVLTCLGLGRSFSWRLEDAGGWPLGNPVSGGSVTVALGPGVYRYLSFADEVPTRRVFSVRQMASEAGYNRRGKLTGMELNRTYSKVWVETEARAEDMFTLEIPAEISATFSVTKGMLFRILDPSGSVTYQGVGGKQLNVTLSRGSWRIGVSAADVDNLKEYELSVTTGDLYVGTSREIFSSPAWIPVTVGKAGTAEIWSYGASELDADLVDETGAVVAEGETIPDDWNFRIVTGVKPGRYALYCFSPLAALAAPAPQPEARPRSSNEDEEDGEYAGDEYAEEEYSPPAPQAHQFNLPGGEAQVLMIVRDESVLPAAAGSLDVGLELADEVAIVPFTAREGGVYRLSGQAAGPLSAAVLKGDRVLASGAAPLFLPLTAGGVYTLRYWRTTDQRSGVRLTASLEPAGETAGDVRTSVLKIASAAGASFAVEAAGGPLLFSPGAEIPFRALTDAAVSTTAGMGWAVRPDGSSIGRCSVTPVALADSTAAAVQVGGIAAGFTITVPARSVALVRTDNAGKPVGISAAGTESSPPALFDWQGARVDGRASVIGLREGAFRGRLWETARGNSAPRRVVVSSEIFPVASDTALGSADRTLVVPPRSAVSLAAGPRQSVRVSLEKGMAAFAWSGAPAGILDAPDAASTGLLEPGGGTVVVVNRTRAPALCVLRPTPAAPRQEVSDGDGFEAVLPAGTDLVLTLHTAAGARPYLWGRTARVRWLGQEDGRISVGEAVPSELPGLLAFPGGRGRLELTAAGGPLRVWVSTADTFRADFAGRDQKVRAAPLPGEGGTLSPGAQTWSITVDRQSIVRVRTDGDGISALFDASGVCLSATAATGGRTLLARLEAGVSTLSTRPFRGTAATAGLVQSRVLTPVPLDADGAGEPTLIGPRDAVLYRFTVKEKGKVGCGIRVESDGLSASLYDESFRLLDTGRIFVGVLPAGVHYLLVESSADTQRFTPVVFGLAGNRTRIPDEVIQQYRGE